MNKKIKNNNDNNNKPKQNKRKYIKPKQIKLKDNKPITIIKGKIILFGDDE
jgi:hypothetical protein